MMDKIFIAVSAMLIVGLYILLPATAHSQLSVDITNVVNNDSCGGDPCYYPGPTILINEVMMSPTSYDGCIWDDDNSPMVCKGEWFELYNPDWCNPIDVSCYMFGNSASDDEINGGMYYTNYGAAYVFPPNLPLVPPLGFVVLRGENATPVPSNLLVQNGGNTVEIIVTDEGTGNICFEGNRFWFPNAGGWVAFYDADGVPQDAIYWNNGYGYDDPYSGAACYDFDEPPCAINSTVCSFQGTLMSGEEILNNYPERINMVYNGGIPSGIGQTVQRSVDGGPWLLNQTGPPTIGDCNATCIEPPEITCDGEATASPSGGTPPYTYLWSNDQIYQSITGICAGEHCVTVTDAAGNSAVECVTIYDPDGPDLLLDSTNVSCYGYSDGEIDLTPSAGTPGFIYEWNTGANSQDISGLGPGEYSVTVTDAANCTSIDTTTIVEPTQLVIITAGDTTICDYENADISASVSGGTPPYSYTWDNGLPGGNGSSTVHNISPGTGNYGNFTYNVTFTDDNGCEISGSVTIISIPCGCITPPVPFEITPPLCCGDNAIITYTGPGIGTNDTTNLVDPEWQWDIGGGTLVSGSLSGTGTVPDNLEVLYPCNANFTVSLYVQNHENGEDCDPADTTFSSSVPEELTCTVTGSDPLCYGSCDAYATITAFGGTGTHSFEWDNGAGNNSTANDLCGGTTYNVTVTDENLCICTGSHTPVDPPLLTLVVTGDNPTCYGACDATATSQTQGGTGDYTYLWDNNAGTAPDASDLCGGTQYTLTVTDENNCTATDSHTPVDPPEVIPDEPVITNVTCFGYGDGSITVSAIGGTGILTYYLTPIVYNTTGIFTSLDAGSYTITVTDENGCTDIIPATVTEPPQLVLNINSDTICITELTSLTVSAYGGTPDYTYLWNTGDSVSTIYLSPGITTNYSVIVTDANNCIETINTSIFVYPPLAIQVYPDDTICVGESTTIYASYSGGMGEPYTLVLNGGPVIQTPYTVSPTETTIYEICVNDNCPTPQACDDLEIVVMPDPPVNFVADIYEGCEPLTVNFSEINQHLGQTYQWNFGDPWGSTTGYGKNPVHTFENPGIYDVSCTVTSEFGCTSSWTWYEMISVWPNPVAAFFPYPQVATILEPYVYFENNSSTYYITNWTFGDGDSSNVIHPQHKYDGPGTYNVMLAVETEHGCVDTTWSEVVIQDIITFYAPTAFSPDFDQMNGLFSPIGHGIDRDHWHLMIYDRWGEKIWETYIYDADEETGEVYHGWDGTIRGRKIGETATYAWLVIYRDVTGAEHQRSGLVTLIR